MLQPLDVGVFGVAKTVIYSNAKESYFELIRPEEDRWFATSKCVEALRDINCATVQRSWMLTFPFWKDLLISNNMLLQEQIAEISLYEIAGFNRVIILLIIKLK